MAIPTFGHKEEGQVYKARYGVYAILANEDQSQLILVQAPNGAWFLPGGEIEEDEDHQTALERELLEELGFSAQIGPCYGQADEYFYSSHRDQHYYNPAFIYKILSYQEISQPLEDFNQIAWFPVEEAKAKLKRGSHIWGVERWEKDCH